MHYTTITAAAELSVELRNRRDDRDKILRNITVGKYEHRVAQFDGVLIRPTDNLLMAFVDVIEKRIAVIEEDLKALGFEMVTTHSTLEPEEAL
jgi:argonaute-like protein implicated in RNA metabolism and viral defense